jgi:hypothetical protein
MSTQLDQIAKKAKLNPKLRFTSLAHLLTPEFLTETWKQMNRRGASGVDGETTKEFERGAKGAGHPRRDRNGPTGNRRSPMVSTEGGSLRWVARAVISREAYVRFCERPGV